MKRIYFGFEHKNSLSKLLPKPSSSSVFKHLEVDGDYPPDPPSRSSFDQPPIKKERRSNLNVNNANHHLRRARRGEP